MSIVSLRASGKIYIWVIHLTLLLIFLTVWRDVVGGEGAISSDFVATYSGLRLIHTGQAAQLYDFAAQRAVQHQFIRVNLPPEDLLPYITPPFFLLPLLPLGWLPYQAAFGSMVIINLILMGLMIHLLRSHIIPQPRIGHLTIGLACFAFFPAFVNLIQGQNAALTLLIFTVTYLLLTNNRPLSGGLMLGLALYKPQLLFGFALVLLLKRQWLTLLGISLTAIFLVIVSLLMVGLSGVIDYARLTLLDSPLADGLYGVEYAAMHNWRALFRVGLGAEQPILVNGLTLMAALMSLAVLVWAWRGAWRSPAFDTQVALTLLVSLLISPHLNTHDLTLWILVGALLLRTVPPQPLTQIVGVIVLGTLIPLVTFPLNSVLFVPLTTLFMAGLSGWLLWRITFRRCKNYQ